MTIVDFLLRLAGDPSELEQYHQNPVAYVNASDLLPEDKALLLAGGNAETINGRITQVYGGDAPIEVTGDAGTVIYNFKKP